MDNLHPMQLIRKKLTQQKLIPQQIKIKISKNKYEVSTPTITWIVKIADRFGFYIKGWLETSQTFNHNKVPYLVSQSIF